MTAAAFHDSHSWAPAARRRRSAYVSERQVVFAFWPSMVAVPAAEPHGNYKSKVEEHRHLVPVLQMALDDWIPGVRRQKRPRRHRKPVTRHVRSDFADPGPRSLGTKPISVEEFWQMLEDIKALADAGQYDHRPSRGNGFEGDCPPGPCGFVSCRHNKFIDVNHKTGAVIENFPGKEIDEVGETCTLRIADALDGGDPMEFKEIGKQMNLNEESVRLIFVGALVKIRRHPGVQLPDGH